MPDIAIAHSKKKDKSESKSASSKSEKKLKDAKPKSDKVKSDKPKEKKDKKRSNDDSSDSAKDEKKKKSSAKKIKTDSTSEAATTTASATTTAVAREFYEKHNISVTGDDSFMPYLDFAQTPFGSDILKACAKFAKPTPIQSACWPVVTAARDVIGIAETGSGKTYAFALPAIHWLAQKHGDQAKKCKKPLVLIVSPTRELAIQTHEQCLEAGKALGITSVCLYGGSSKSQQGAELRQAKPAIIVATPGRLIDVVENDQTLDL
ncbi:RNA-dependent ATPase, partial [Coemansia furcata]